MWQEVAPPAQAQEPTFGLLAAVGETPGEAGWEHGIVWRSEGGRIVPQIVDPCDDTDEGPPVRGRSYVLTDPVSFRVRDHWQGRPDLMDDQRVVRAALAATSAAVARELWLGEGTRARLHARPGYLGGTAGATEANPYLVDGNAAVINGQHSPEEGIAALEEIARQRSAATVPIVLHVPSRVAQLAAQSLTRVGNTLRTVSGSVVVADAGYPGSGPSGSGVWGFATGPLAVRLGAVVSTTDRAQTIDRRHNARETWASRSFAVGFDPAVQVGIQFDVPALTVTEPSGGTP